METTTRWYHYIAYFFGGAFLANTIPHLVSGISGSPFQSPFASPKSCRRSARRNEIAARSLMATILRD